MTLANHYSIAIKHQRSTRIDSDLNTSFFEGLVYHGTAQTAIETLLRQFGQANQSAYTLTGPYGSGKSTIALLLAGLLNHNSDIRTASLKVINYETQELLKDSLNYSQGWLQIRAVGGVNDPIETFFQATLNALKDHPNTKELSKKYNGYKINSESKLIGFWEKLFDEIGENVDGVLLLADEMGKTLEFINKNNRDLHLFQDLAEVLGRVNKQVIFLGLLHQAFSEYAKERGTKLQEEWAKIQGRYSDIPYNVSTDETVALIAQSIIPSNGVAQADSNLVDKVLGALNDTHSRKEQLSDRLLRCAPLHPLTALLLGPISKRRFSQNERSTFSFLNSREQHSFQMFLQHESNKSAFYDLSNLWDFLETNLEHTILSSPDGHAWAEASEAINRVDVPKIALAILKAIALINLFGKPANIYATNSILQAAVGIDDDNDLQKYLTILEQASCIIYRKHQSSWVIFEGSDIDLPTKIEEIIGQLSESSEVINHINYTQQTMAKGHYHTAGTLRWIEQSVTLSIDSFDAKKVMQNRTGEIANFLLLIKPATQEQLIKFTNENRTIALANASNTAEIEGFAREVYALELLKSDEGFGSELQHDRIAKKEYDGRLSEASKMLISSIEESFANAQWYIDGRSHSNTPLSSLATDIADNLYLYCPKLLNELVNKNKLSGAAVSARKKLLEAMLQCSDKENLGITGFPPEMSMYISCLKNTKLHAYIENKWCWSPNGISMELKRLFDTTTAFLKDNAGKKIKLTEIERLWSNAPFGLTSGVIPIYMLAYMKILGDNIAHYEYTQSREFEFLAVPDIDYVHKLQKNLDEVAIKYITLEKSDIDWIQHLASYAAEITTQTVKNNLLSVVTPLVTIMHGLPHWVKNATNLVQNDRILNKRVITIRDTFLQAKDPHALIINDLVNILDESRQFNNKQRIDLLAECFLVLRDAHENMLKDVYQRIKAMFPESGDELVKMCAIVEKNAGDLRLKSFARELSRSQKFGQKWLESLISVALGRGPQSWNESNLLVAIQKINEYSQDFLRIIKATHHIDGQYNTACTQGTKTISLVLENEDGKLINYRKEIRSTNPESISSTMNILRLELNKLSEFERIDILQQLLQASLEAKS